MKKRSRMFMFEVIEWSNPLDLAYVFKLIASTALHGKHFQGTTVKDSMVKAP